jgi:hypothetical protein
LKALERALSEGRGEQGKNLKKSVDPIINCRVTLRIASFHPFSGPTLVA